MVDVGNVLEDPRGRKRTVPMKVLCLGIGRSGTESLCAALSILNIPTYHGWQTIANPRHNMLWYEAAESKYLAKGKVWKREDYDQLLGRSSACTDFPAGMFPLELIEAYPEAKVILNRRRTEVWWESYKANILPLKESWKMWLLGHLDWEFYQTFILWTHLQDFYFRTDPRRNAEQIYREHCALIRGATPAARFLEWDPSEGWAPLCKFLDVPVPEVEFPYRNQQEEFERTVEGYFRPRMARAVRNLAGLSVVVLGVVGYGVVKFRSGGWMLRGT